MKTLSEVVTLVGQIEQTELVGWVEQGWVAPSRAEAPEPVFSELDIARIRMICDLRRDLVVEEETMPLVLSLLDQVYGLRRQVTVLTAAIQKQPASVRDAILQALNQTDRDNG
ncbi:MAG: chaperone modulator CbpM [Geminicoccaceae bacterium]